MKTLKQQNCRSVCFSSLSHLFANEATSEKAWMNFSVYTIFNPVHFWPLKIAIQSNIKV